MTPTPRDTPKRNLETLPLAALFDVQDGETVGLQALSDLGVRLRERQHCSWSTTKLMPEGTDWLVTTIGAYDDPTDWTEVDVSIRSWRSEAPGRPGAWQRLWVVWVSLEVTCWCEPDHNVHRVEQRHFEVGSISGLERACDEAIATVDDWLAAGLLPSERWREKAGLPRRPASSSRPPDAR